MAPTTESLGLIPPACAVLSPGQRLVTRPKARDHAISGLRVFKTSGFEADAADAMCRRRANMKKPAKKWVVPNLSSACNLLPLFHMQHAVHRDSDSCHCFFES